MFFDILDITKSIDAIIAMIAAFIFGRPIERIGIIIVRASITIVKLFSKSALCRMAFFKSLPIKIKFTLKI